MTKRINELKDIETVCKRCIDRGAEKWAPRSNEDYMRMFSRLKWKQNIAADDLNIILTNISSQLQLLEFLHQVMHDCATDNEDEMWYDESTGKSAEGIEDIDGIAPLIRKQEIIAAGAIVEAICYFILTSNNIKIVEKNTKYSVDEYISFCSALHELKRHRLINRGEFFVGIALKKLRNLIHLYGSQTLDTHVFHWAELDTNPGLDCLYVYLKRWLNADDAYMQLNFPFVRTPEVYGNKIFVGGEWDFEEMLDESSNKYKNWEDVTELTDKLFEPFKKSILHQKSPDETGVPKIYFAEYELDEEGQKKSSQLQLIIHRQVPMAVPLKLRDLKLQLKTARKYKFPYVIIFGPEQEANDEVVIRKMSNNSEICMKISNELIEHLKKISSNS